LSGSSRKWIAFTAKTVVTGGLIWLVVRGVDFESAMTRMARMSVPSAIIAVGLLMLHCFVAGWRWRMVMRLFGAPLPLRDSIRLFFEGYFFNNALPSTIGGDGVRIYRAVRLGMPFGASVSGVLLDRVTGLTGLFILVAAGQPLLYARVEDTTTRLAFAAVLLAGVMGIAAMILARYIPEKFIPGRLREPVHKLSAATRTAYLHPAVSLPVLGLAVLVQGIIVLSVHVIAVGLVPAVILLSTVPVSIGGWGVREGLMVMALGLAGVPADGALSVSILFGLAQIAAGLPGGALWLAAGGGGTD
jgi:hypothetical protein